MRCLLTLRMWIRRLLARWFYLVGQTYRHLGNRYGIRWYYEMAVDYFTQAIHADPTLARAYLDRGILYWRELDHPRRAILDLTEAHELAPHLTEARFNRGVAHQQLREYAQAIEDYRAYLAEGDHPYWREYAAKMIEELSEWVTDDNA